MEKVDYKTTLSSFYKASPRQVTEVDVPPLTYLMVDGHGNPNTAPAYQEAVEALFSVSYAAKFGVKAAGRTDYVVMPLEGLWWSDDMASFTREDKDDWQWTLMIMQPACVSEAVVDEALEKVRAKKPLPALDRLRFEPLHEGRCAQTLHVGPFSEEGPTIERVHAFIRDRSSLRGKHHEIYLSDIRRAAPERWKTIIRQPMA